MTDTNEITLAAILSLEDEINEARKTERDARDRQILLAQEYAEAVCVWKIGDEVKVTTWPDGTWVVVNIRGYVGMNHDRNRGPYHVVTERRILKNGDLGKDTRALPTEESETCIRVGHRPYVAER